MSYNPYRKYCSSWWRYWFNIPEDIIGFIKRVYDYAPLLWEDEDYDFDATLRLMRFKLKRLRLHMEEHAIIAHSEDVVAELALVDVYLRNVTEEDPDDEWSLHHGQWHMYKGINAKCESTGNICRLSLQASAKREKRNWHRIWSYLDKHAQGWWD